MSLAFNVLDCSTHIQDLMPNTFTVEVNVAAVIEPNREHLIEGYGGYADAPHAHLHKCNPPPTPRLGSLKVTKHIIQEIHTKRSQWPRRGRDSPTVSVKACSERSSFRNTRHPFRRPGKECRAGNHMHSKLFCLAAAQNHMLAYHKETLYHSINIGTTLIVNRIISI